MKTFYYTLSVALSLFLVSSAYAIAPCSRYMPEGLSYQPSLDVCEGKAAAVVWGRFKNSFSVVARDAQGGDRDPCPRTRSNPNNCGTNQSSPYKVQKEVLASITRKDIPYSARILCFKESGSSMPFKFVRRLTVKIHNPVQSDSDVARVCLSSRTKVVNPITIVSTGAEKSASGFGFTTACLTQKYLNCTETDLQNFFNSFYK